MKKVMTVFGTRPEAIKMAPVIGALTEHPDFESVVCVTAQHREMLDQILELFDIKPDIDLNVMTQGQQLAGLSATIIQGLSNVFAKNKPDIVLVQGDTTTTFCAALAAFYEKIPVGHIEAGLRTGDMDAPFPEEMNRVLTTRLTTWHFAPTKTNYNNLIQEGVPEEQVYVTGNTVIDALLQINNRINNEMYGDETTSMLTLVDRPFILVTGHRRENFGQGFENICKALQTIAERHPDIDIIYPVHLNPNVQKPVKELLGNFSNIKLIEPLGYEAFVALLSKALFIITDSGGVQEEAPSLGKPVLVMRDKTERIEGIGSNVLLVGTDKDRIIKESDKLISDKIHYEKMTNIENPYGNGNAAKIIVDILQKHSN